MANGTDLTLSRSTPVVDFTSADYSSIRADLITYAQATYPDRWTDFNSNQWAVVMLELISYLGDLLSYQLNSSIRELYSATVTRRQNLINLAKTFAITLNAQAPAFVTLTLTLDPTYNSSYSIPTVLPKTVQFSNGGSGDALVIFQPINDTTIPPASTTIDVACVEGEFFSGVQIGVSNGSPNQRWQFPQDSVIPSTVVVTVGASTWTATSNFNNAQSTGHVYKLITNDDGSVYAVFGDGVAGAIPATNAQILATFRVGGGRRGNLNPGVISTRLSVPTYVLGVTNALASGSGDDPQSMQSGKNAIPAAISTQNRAVTGADYEAVVVQIAGVAKVRSGPSIPAGSRNIRVWVAPSGGGLMSATLKNTISNTVQPKKMVTNRVRLFDANYRDIRITALVHVNSAFRAGDVGPVVRQGLINAGGTGLLDFAQLDFGAVSRNANGDTELMISDSRLQEYFASLSQSGVDRVEILQMDVVPVGRPKDEGNTGNGTVTSITVTSKQRRREYYVLLQNAAQYAVYERIVGYVYSLADTVLTDDDKTFENEGVSSYAGYTLVPRRDDGTGVAVVSAAGQGIVISGSSLFSLTEVGEQYYLYAPTPVIVNVGSPFTSADGNVTFTVTAGSGAFVAGDAFSVNIYPLVSDIRLASDEYPQVQSSNLVTRTSGGARI